VLFTAVSDGPPVSGSLRDKVSLYAVEAEPLAAALINVGVRPERVRVVYPGVDLERFRPASAPSGPFRVLFASTPANLAEFEARGIPLLVEIARMRPDVQVVVRWRRWGDTQAAAAALRALSPSPNLIVEPEADDMAVAYRGVHATICAFAQGFGKACPNSIIEGLASGRPALLTDTCGIASLVERKGAGISAARSVMALLQGLDAIRADIVGYSARARALAEETFDLTCFRRTYAEMYQELDTGDLSAANRRTEPGQPRHAGRD
jgi:glycosyltransferase involved in cell wall biosynthesis